MKSQAATVISAAVFVALALSAGAVWAQLMPNAEGVVVHKGITADAPQAEGVKTYRAAGMSPSRSQAQPMMHHGPRTVDQPQLVGGRTVWLYDRKKNELIGCRFSRRAGIRVHRSPKSLSLFRNTRVPRERQIICTKRSLSQ